MPCPVNPYTIPFNPGLTHEPDPVVDGGSSGPTYEPD